MLIYEKLNINKRINLKSWMKMMSPKAPCIVGLSIAHINNVAWYVGEWLSYPYLDVPGMCRVKNKD